MIEEQEHLPCNGYNFNTIIDKINELIDEVNTISKVVFKK